MTVLRPRPVVSTSLFTKSESATQPSGGCILVAEMSDLNAPLGRVYDDACDVGLTLVSARTGREVVMAVTDEQRDREGELLWIDLRPAIAKGIDVTVRLYND